MRIVITGGLGFIGLALCRRLLEAGHAVRLVDSLSPQIHGALPDVLAPEGAEVLRADVRRLGDHPEALADCDAVYHLAAETGTAQSMYRIEEYTDVNATGTAALLQALARAPRRPRKVVLASSRSVYGEGAYAAEGTGTIVQPGTRSKAQLEAGQWEPRGPRGEMLRPVPTPETLPFAPSSVYAATKAAQELLLLSAAEALGIEPVVFRFQNVYGEGQSLMNPYTGIISIFFNRARQGLEIPLYEDGLESRDFVHVADIVDALVAALQADVPPGLPMNLGSGEPTSVRMLANELLAASGFKASVRVSGQYRVGDIRHCYADLGRARDVLGYKPRVSLAQGLARFCAWAAQQPAYQDRLDAAAEELRRKGLGT
ncbi:MAG: NAD-dependent epimerase/dehydratase family protein [Burkholderiaceae bacterium]|nr:MAG: NAD-dependent epimerase/dehydratase family protein [Burkholderiaceae bacterium]